MDGRQFATATTRAHGCRNRTKRTRPPLLGTGACLPPDEKQLGRQPLMKASPEASYAAVCLPRSGWLQRRKLLFQLKAQKTKNDGGKACAGGGV